MKKAPKVGTGKIKDICKSCPIKCNCSKGPNERKCNSDKIDGFLIVNSRNVDKVRIAIKEAFDFSKKAKNSKYDLSCRSSFKHGKTFGICRVFVKDNGEVKIIILIYIPQDMLLDEEDLQKLSFVDDETLNRAYENGIIQITEDALGW